MDLQIQSLGIPDSIAGWKILENSQPTSYKAFMADPVLQQQIAYFEKNASSATTASQLMSNPQLQDFVLTAYGLTAESGMTALMTKVLNSNPNDSNSFASQMTNQQYTQIADDFNYGGTITPATPAVPSTANVEVDDLGSGSTIASFSGSFGGITLTNVDTSDDTTLAQLANTLQGAFQRADGGRSNITVGVFGDSLQFTDALGRGGPSGFTWDTDSAGPQVVEPTSTSASSSTASQVALSLPTVTSFSGTFGGITVNNVDTSGDATTAELAQTLQSAFQSADGGADNITVTANGNSLSFQDAKGRGPATGFTWDTSGSSGTAPQAGSVSNTSAGLDTTSTVGITGLGLGSTPAFTSFSGSFAGVSVSSVDTSGDKTMGALAQTLQSAFQSADNGASDITVTATATGLQFADDKGRAAASSFTWNSGTGGPQAATAVSTPGGSTSATVGIAGLGASAAPNLDSFSGTFAGLTVSGVDLSDCQSWTDVASTLQSAFQNADGGQSNITVQATDTGLNFTDALGRAAASPGSFTWTGPSGATTLAQPVSTPSGASSSTVSITGLGSTTDGISTFSGTFAGVTLNNVDVSSATTLTSLASLLQTAFTNAEGSSAQISVNATSNGLQFVDAMGGATASGFTFTDTQGPQVGSPTGVTAGSVATAQQGGPSVTSPAFIQQVVQKYIQAQFETVIGNTSNTLREAEYAKQELPKITNWYQVMADLPLANVIQTVLGLPSSFGELNVDQQNQILSSRMNIQDFQNPTKLNALLNQYVGMSEAQNGSTMSDASIASTLISNAQSKSTIINVTVPSTTTLPTSSTYSNAATAALVLSTAMDDSDS